MRLFAWFALCLVSGATARTWIWQGALMPTSIRFSVKTDETEDFTIVAATEDHRNLSFARKLEQEHMFQSSVWSDGSKSSLDEQIQFNVSATKAFHMVLEGLQPDTAYTWSATGDLHGKFRTPPRPGARYNFTFAFGSCADNDSDHVLFSLIPYNQHPLFMIHMGDLHYGNLARNKFDDFAMMYDRTLLRPNQAHMFRNVPVAYMWDDHDFGPNKTSTVLDANLHSKHFDMFVPSYAYGSLKPDGARFYSFVIGRILFLVTDTSSERDPHAKTTLGTEQLSWMREKLELASRKPNELAAIVWVSTLPWIDDHYKWGEFPEERAIIGSWINELHLSDRLIIVSGDAHMLAVDDGTHSVGHVKVFHAAAIDAKPTTKGGPYSHGVWPGRNQYGTIQVRDIDSKICFLFQGWKWKRDKVLGRLVSFDTCDESQNVPFLYKPSPLFVQRAWKRLKKMLEESELTVFIRFVVLVDSTRLTFNDFIDVRLLFGILSIPFLFSIARNVRLYINTR